MLTATLIGAEIATPRLAFSLGGRWLPGALGGAEAAAYFFVVSCAGGRTVWNWFIDFGDR